MVTELNMEAPVGYCIQEQPWNTAEVTHCALLGTERCKKYVTCQAYRNHLLENLQPEQEQDI